MAAPPPAGSSTPAEAGGSIGESPPTLTSSGCCGQGSHSTTSSTPHHPSTSAVLPPRRSAAAVPTPHSLSGALEGSADDAGRLPRLRGEVGRLRVRSVYSAHVFEQQAQCLPTRERARLRHGVAHPDVPTALRRRPNARLGRRLRRLSRAAARRHGASPHVRRRALLTRVSCRPSRHGTHRDQKAHSRRATQHDTNSMSPHRYKALHRYLLQGVTQI